MSEVRITDPKTGGQKGQKPAQLGAIDPQSLMRLAEVAGFGASKYERLNFAKGYAWSLSYDAMQRHLHAFWSGEEIDPESGLPHLAHAAWHALTLLTFVERSRGTDDRLPTLLKQWSSANAVVSVAPPTCVHCHLQQADEFTNDPFEEEVHGRITERTWWCRACLKAANDET